MTDGEIIGKEECENRFTGESVETLRRTFMYDSLLGMSLS